MPPVTTALIVANVAVFLLQSAAPGVLVPFALWPLATGDLGIGASFLPWQIVTYAFLHGSLLHLAFNMFALYMFGSALERVFGARRYAVLYFASVIAAAITQLVFAAVILITLASVVLFQILVWIEVAIISVWPVTAEARGS